MRSQEQLHQAFFGHPSEPGYPRRLTPYQMEQLARAERSMMLGELIADGFLWLARLPSRLFVRRGRPAAQRA
jgi:hypothetical protein